MNIGVLLSGCGVYDGAEIQESVITLLKIQEMGFGYTCIGVDDNQHHVVNHLDGSEMNETRNMLVEAARIARGEIVSSSEIDLSALDALVIPGGFGSVKNFTKWAFHGPKGEIHPEVKKLLVNCYNAGKPIVALCVSPVVLAKALENNDPTIEMTIGSDVEKSPYDIHAFVEGLRACGVQTNMRTSSEILIDSENRIITAPCYMMEASLVEVSKNISMALQALQQMLEQNLHEALSAP